MEDVIQMEARPDPRPYGPFGLLLSLGAMILIAAGALLVTLCLAALVDVLLLGWPHLRESFTAAAALVHGGPQEALLTLGLGLGSALYLAGIFAIWTMARLRAGPGWPVLVGWTPFRLDRTFWTLLAAAIAYGPIASLLITYLNPAAKQLFALPDNPFGMAAGLFLVVILAPLSEELLFRGWIYTALRVRFGFSAALWASAVLFALAHWESTHLYAVVILPIGLVLGYLRERTGSARATTLFHMIYNFSALALSFLGKV